MGFFATEKGTGALLDTRSPQEQLKDYLFTEAVTEPESVEWIEKDPKDWRKFPIFDQNGSGSCVAQTMAKLLGILYWLKNKDYVHFSATDIYQRRANKPYAGMAGVDAFNIARQGVTLEVLAPSQKLTDEQMDSVVLEQYKREVGNVFKIENYLVMPVGDIDIIASTIKKTGKGVMVWFYFSDGLTPKEWTEVPEVKHPNLSVSGSKTARHSVTAVDYTLYKGQKALIIEDSWGIGHALNGQRVITEDFFTARNFFAAYPIGFDFGYKYTPDKPEYEFDNDLEFSNKFTRPNDDVVALQDILKFEGLFPVNIESSGFYGAITAKAVDAFQRKHKVAPYYELDALQGKRVGEKTREVLNDLY